MKNLSCGTKLEKHIEEKLESCKKKLAFPVFLGESKTNLSGMHSGPKLKINKQTHKQTKIYTIGELLNEKYVADIETEIFINSKSLHIKTYQNKNLEAVFPKLCTSQEKACSDSFRFIFYCEFLLQG